MKGTASSVRHRRFRGTNVAKQGKTQAGYQAVEGNEMSRVKTLLRLAVSLGSIVAMLLAGGAIWRIGGLT